MAKSTHLTTRAIRWTSPPLQHHPPRPHPHHHRRASGIVRPAGAWVIPDYIGEGLTILAGRRNSGKSWLALDWAIAVARGGSAMGSVACEPGDVLYIDLENGERRIRSRLDTFFSRGKPPRLPRLQWLNEAPLDENFVGILEDWRVAVSEPRLVVIDALHPLQPPAGAGHDGLDSAALGALRRWASGHPVAVVCLLRTRKAPAMDALEAPADALFACADAVLLLGEDDGGPTLDVCGRDVSERQMALSLDECRWSLHGNAAEIRISTERQNILDVLRDHNQVMTPKRNRRGARCPSRNVRQLLFHMLRDGEVVTPWKTGYLVAPE